MFIVTTLIKFVIDLAVQIWLLAPRAALVLADEVVEIPAARIVPVPRVAVVRDDHTVLAAVAVVRLAVRPVEVARVECLAAGEPEERALGAQIGAADPVRGGRPAGGQMLDGLLGGGGVDDGQPLAGTATLFAGIEPVGLGDSKELKSNKYNGDQNAIICAVVLTFTSDK